MPMVFLNGDNSAGAAGGDGPELDTTTVIGISVAIAGNILISLALNLQKLAHKRIERERNGKPHDEEEGSRTPQRSSNSEQPHSQHELNGVFGDAAERQPLIPFPHDADLYSATSSGQSTPHDGHHKPFRLSRFLSRRPLVQAIAPFPDRNGSHIAQIPVDVIGEDELTPHSRKDGQNGGHAPKPPSSPVADNETAYLKSKLWWTGFLLMNVGELGNFISYAWAPASVVAPLGTFALIANCFFAPLMIGERFRKRDLLGIAIAVLGAVTVVLSTQSSDTRLDPDALIHAISKTPFAAYTIIYLVLGIILVTLSPGRFGQKYVCVDVGLCALFGGFTVLSTKAVSTLLTMEWINIFTHWITYVVIAVLILTGVGQIRYLNRALMRFDSKVVIPMQFVLFNLSAIVGSAILYGDFERAKFHQIVTFLYGCGATFLGVFIIAWAGPGDGEGTEGEGEDVEDGEEEDGEDGGDGAYGEGSTPAGAIRSPRGSLGRRKRPVLIVPSGSRDLPILRRKQSIMGLSPAHPLLLVHTPPSEIPRTWDLETALNRNSALDNDHSLSPTLNRNSTYDAVTFSRIREDSPGDRTRRLRTMSWFEGEAAALRPREHSLTRPSEGGPALPRTDNSTPSREGGSTLSRGSSRTRGSSLSGERRQRLNHSGSRTSGDTES